MAISQAIFGNDRHAARPMSQFFDRWTIGAVLLSCCVAAPIVAVFVIATGTGGEIWAHLFETVLPRYVQTTLALMIGVGLGTFILGTGTGWLVAAWDFPGRRIFEWALLLPLAVPGFVIAFVYTDILEYAGPVQGMLRALFGWTSPRDYWFPEIRSLGGAIAMLSLVLYPYVYLLSRAAFLEQSADVLEASRTLGRGPVRNFLTVAIPLARPAIVIGISLALMETLNDFGTVDFFAVQTLTLGIFDVWLNQNSVAGAAQIASTMLVFVLCLILAERFSRRQQRYHGAGRPSRRQIRMVASGPFAAFVVIVCLIPLSLGFVLPVAVLLSDAVFAADADLVDSFLQPAANSLFLSGAAALLAVAVGLFLAYAVRLRGSRLLKVLTRITGLGYAVPGAVLAVGVMIPLAAFDNWVDGYFRQIAGISTGLLLSGTVFALIFGYVVRFLALSQGAIESSLARITPSIDGAARTLGATPGRVLRDIHLPLIRGSMLSAAILVFVDGMKELPMTIVMRPFNFDTLATEVHQFAAAEQFAEASPAALAIVLTGILPVIILVRVMDRDARKREAAGTRITGTGLTRTGIK